MGHTCWPHLPLLTVTAVFVLHVFKTTRFPVPTLTQLQERWWRQLNPLCAGLPDWLWTVANMLQRGSCGCARDLPREGRLLLVERVGEGWDAVGVLLALPSLRGGSSFCPWGT